MTEPAIVDTWERLVRYHRRATMEMDDHLRATCGHSLDDYDVLHQIHTNGAPIQMGDLADRLLVANSSCHRIIGRLAEAGFVSRRHGDVDRRQVLVGLTAEGKRLRRRMAAAHTRDIENVLGAPLSADEHLRLHDILGRLLTDE